MRLEGHSYTKGSVWRGGGHLRGMRAILAMGSIALLAALLTACGTGATPTPAPTPTPVPTQAPAENGTTPEGEAWEAEWEELIAAAQAEGALTWSAGRPAAQEFRPLAEAFQEKFGIETTLGGGTGGQEAERIRAEARAGQFLVDIFMGGTTNGEVLRDEGLLKPVADAFVLPEVIDESLWFRGQHSYSDRERQFIFVYSGVHRGADIIINKDLVNPDDINSYWDLLHPRYRGQIVSLFLGESGQAGSVQEWYGRMGPDYLRQLILEHDLTMIDDERVAKDWLVLGVKSIGIFMGFTEDIHELEAAGAPVTIMTKTLAEGATIAGGGAASMVMTPGRQPHPHAAKLFLNWFLSREGQLLMQNVYNERQSLREDIPTDMIRPEYVRQPGLPYIDPRVDHDFLELRTEALEFVRDLIDEWRRQQG